MSTNSENNPPESNSEPDKAETFIAEPIEVEVTDPSIVADNFDETNFDHDFDDDFEEEIDGEYDLEDDQYGEEFRKEFGHLTKDEDDKNKSKDKKP